MSVGVNQIIYSRMEKFRSTMKLSTPKAMPSPVDAYFVQGLLGRTIFSPVVLDRMSHDYVVDFLQRATNQRSGSIVEILDRTTMILDAVRASFVTMTGERLIYIDQEDYLIFDDAVVLVGALLSHHQIHDGKAQFDPDQFVDICIRFRNCELPIPELLGDSPAPQVALQ